MQEFDPRRPTFRLTPRLAIGAAGVAALALGWKLTADEAAAPPKAPLDPAVITALQTLIYAPKIIAIFVSLILFLPLMGALLGGFMRQIAARIAGM